MATQVDKEFLAETNKKLGTTYKSIKEYLTDGGKIDLTSAKSIKRKASIENYRGKAKRKEMVLSGAVVEEAKKIYGATANLYAIPELQSIFNEAFINQWDPDTLVRAIDNTEWATSRTQSQESYDVQKATNPVELQSKVDSYIPTIKRVLASKGITIDDAAIKSIAEKGVRNGWTPEQWDSDSAAEALRIQPQEEGTKVGAGSVSPVTATMLRMVAKEFGVKPTEETINSWVKEISTNSKTKEQFGETMRSSAQTLYPTLGERLKTETFDSITSPYKTLYAQVLEVGENSVDLTSPAYSNLFNAGDENNKRMMNATEWTSFLRKRPEWQNTQNAYQEYSSAASALNKIFGGTR